MRLAWAILGFNLRTRLLAETWLTKVVGAPREPLFYFTPAKKDVFGHLGLLSSKLRKT